MRTFSCLYRWQIGVLRHNIFWSILPLHDILPVPLSDSSHLSVGQPGHIELRIRPHINRIRPSKKHPDKKLKDRIRIWLRISIRLIFIESQPGYRIQIKPGYRIADLGLDPKPTLEKKIVFRSDFKEIRSESATKETGCWSGLFLSKVNLDIE